MRSEGRFNNLDFLEHQRSAPARFAAQRARGARSNPRAALRFVKRKRAGIRQGVAL
jgi:hypothetical protein